MVLKLFEKIMKKKFIKNLRKGLDLEILRVEKRLDDANKILYDGWYLIGMIDRKLTDIEEPPVDIVGLEKMRMETFENVSKFDVIKNVLINTLNGLKSMKLLNDNELFNRLKPRIPQPVLKML
jgi:hypothetical protein